MRAYQLPKGGAGIDALHYEILNGGVSSCANALEREAYTLSARWAYC